MDSNLKRRGRKAWLVTWEHVGHHAVPGESIVAVFKPQLSGQRVRDLVDCIYAVLQYSPRERMDYALNPKAAPYRAQFFDFGGVPWYGAVHCGHNPFLKARLVNDLVIDDDSGATWIERPTPMQF